MNNKKLFHTGTTIEALTDIKGNFAPSASSFSHMMELISDGIIFVNRKWEYEYVNKTAEEMINSDRSELIGEEMWSVFPDLVKTAFYDRFHNALMNGSTEEFDEYYSPMDKWYHVKAVPEEHGLLIILQDITQKHVAMEVVEESYRTLFQKHPDAVCSMDLDGNILAINRAFKKYFPLDEKMYLGSFYLSFVPATHKSTVESLFKGAINGKPQAAEFDLSEEAGKPMYALLTALPIIVQSQIIGVYGIIKDLTAERDSLNKYIEVSKINDMILQSVGEGIAAFDKNLNIVLWNQAAEKMTGFKKEELTPEVLRQIFNYNDPSGKTAVIPYLQEGEGCSVEIVDRQSDVTVCRKNGTPFIIEYVLTPMVKAGETAGLVLTFSDITEKKKSEEMLFRSEKLSAVGQLAAGIAHEIRNPLTSLKGFLQLIQMSGEGKKEYFEIMDAEFSRIEQILNELLVLSKPQVLNKEICDLNSLLDHIITLLNTQAIIKNIYISKSADEGPFFVKCISNQIKQVFMNFIKNAIEAMNRGEISVRLRKKDGFALVEIKDEGCGIPEEMLKRIGEPFFTTKEKGTGLGLMVSYQIIEEHDGEVQVESSEGEGTTFTVKLPFARHEINS